VQFIKILIKKFVIFLSAITVSIQLYPQSSINAGGGGVTNSAGSISFSIGQLVNSIMTKTSGTIMTGIQLPYEILVISGVDNSFIDLQIKVFPNPATDYLIIETDLSFLTSEMFYAVIDGSGKVIISNKVVNSTTAIPVNNLIYGVYFLQIRQGAQLIKSFKIIKKQIK
jgi:hypothetical protein